MAFIRWRGRCCELIVTVYENGRSKKITLANLQTFYVPEWIKKGCRKVSWNQGRLAGDRAGAGSRSTRHSNKKHSARTFGYGHRRALFT